MFEEIKQRAKWGTYGKSGKEPLQYKRLIDLTTEHLQAILDTQPHISNTQYRGFSYDLLIMSILADRERVRKNLEPDGSWVNL